MIPSNLRTSSWHTAIESATAEASLSFAASSFFSRLFYEL